MTPLKRFLNLLKLDRKDISQIILYAIFSGILALSLPLGIQAIINFIQAGNISVSWMVLVFLVILGVALVGVLSLMQMRITENLQQKLFVRSAFEFAYRIPTIKFEELYKNHPLEIANKFFDTLTIQKGTSKLLIDFSAALLQVLFALILLSFYHPFFIIFGILLVILLYLIFAYAYKPGLETSLKESKYKYKVVGWLQEIAKNYWVFKTQNSFLFSLSKNDLLVTEYLNYREKHFKIIRAQYIKLIAFKVIITASLLIIGGLLVIKQQMNIGQFVAAEIVILMVIASVEKIILGLETFYDVLTSVEKIGQVTDLPLDTIETSNENYLYSIINLTIENVSYKFPDATKSALKNVSLNINQGEKIILSGENGSGKSTLIRFLTGTLVPNTGAFYINDDTFKKIDLNLYRKHIGVVLQNETPFEGTILENITFGKPYSDEDLKWVLDTVELTEFVKTLPNNLDTKVMGNGLQLSASNMQKIVLAKSLISKPKILFLEEPVDKLDTISSQKIISTIMHHKTQTVIVISKNEFWKANATREITLHSGKIINDIKL
jgi:ABC-type bacteriocin/lantibiotic exporter with double-glycine peptidase domain